MASTSSFHDIVAGLKPLSNLASPREMIRQFTPNWFAATMGTGILAVALGLFPGGALKPWGEALWYGNVVLFAACSLLYGLRWIFFFDGARRILGHSVVSMFFGCIPMGLATIINGLLIFFLPQGGDSVVQIAQTLWWADVVMAVFCGIAIPYLMFTRQDHSIDKMTAVWLLPVVAAEVAAASGGLLAPHLAAASQLTVLVSSYILWALSVPLALSILAIFILRMAVHKLPPANMAASSWLALGPLGTGALGLLVMGNAAPAIFTAYGLGALGDTARGIGIIGGLMLWGYGLWWMAMAILITFRYLRTGLPFNLGWWGYTFPLGVYTVATLRLGIMLPIHAFTLFGEILVAALSLMWLIVAALSLRGAWRGDLFVAPCLLENS
jgi:C4-dicarboxylate transporter/malic acid transport protein